MRIILSVAQAIKAGLSEIAFDETHLYQNRKMVLWSQTYPSTIEEWQEDPRPPVSEPYWHLADK
jgi:hypothetical protein